MPPVHRRPLLQQRQCPRSTLSLLDLGLVLTTMLLPPTADSTGRGVLQVSISLFLALFFFVACYSITPRKASLVNPWRPTRQPWNASAIFPPWCYLTTHRRILPLGKHVVFFHDVAPSATKLSTIQLTQADSLFSFTQTPHTCLANSSARARARLDPHALSVTTSEQQPRMSASTSQRYVLQNSASLLPRLRSKLPLRCHHR